MVLMSESGPLSATFICVWHKHRESRTTWHVGAKGDVGCVHRRLIVQIVDVISAGLTNLVLYSTKHRLHVASRGSSRCARDR